MKAGKEVAGESRLRPWERKGVGGETLRRPAGHMGGPGQGSGLLQSQGGLSGGGTQAET